MELNATRVFQGVGALGAIASLFTGGVGFNKGEFEQQKAVRKARWDRQSSLQASEEERLAQEKIANARFKGGCDLIAGTPRKAKTKGKKQIIFNMPAIVPGVVIKDRYTQKPLVRKTICDAYGLTAITDDQGLPTAIASTGNRDVIADMMARFRGGVYAQPGYEVKLQYSQPLPSDQSFYKTIPYDIHVIG